MVGRQLAVLSRHLPKLSLSPGVFQVVALACLLLLEAADPERGRRRPPGAFLLVSVLSASVSDGLPSGAVLCLKRPGSPSFISPGDPRPGPRNTQPTDLLQRSCLRPEPTEDLWSPHEAVGVTQGSAH